MAPLRQNSVSLIMKPLDTTKGVITRDIYQSGHIDSPAICADLGENIKLLIIITSAPPHRDMRLAIRQTWGHFSTRRDIKIAFLVGMSNEDEKISVENFMYGGKITFFHTQLKNILSRNF